MNSDRLGSRHRTWLERGGDASVWNLEKNKSDVGRARAGMVMKSFEGYDARQPGWQADRVRGFNEPVKLYLEQTHERLRGQYGDAILPCRILANPDESDRYFLVQPHVNPDNPNERLQLLLDQSPNDIQDPMLQERAAKFATSLKSNYERWVRGDKTAVVPDIEKANIVIDKTENRFYYIDNDTMDAPYYGGKKMNRWYDLENVAARLEMLGGRSPEDILSDPFYQALFAEYGKRYPNLHEAKNDSGAFYEILEQMGNDMRAAAIAEFEQYMNRAK